MPVRWEICVGWGGLGLGLDRTVAFQTHPSKTKTTISAAITKEGGMGLGDGG